MWVIATKVALLQSDVTDSSQSERNRFYSVRLTKTYFLKFSNSSQANYKDILYNPIIGLFDHNSHYAAPRGHMCDLQFLPLSAVPSVWCNTRPRFSRRLCQRYTGTVWSRRMYYKCPGPGRAALTVFPRGLLEFASKTPSVLTIKGESLARDPLLLRLH